MNETVVTVTGNVTADPRSRVIANGSRVTSFRLASTERRYDKGLGEWRDGQTVFYTVTCWRTLAENVGQSVRKGQPLVVQGRLRVSTYDDKEGLQRTSVEIEARSVGHDLAWGVSTFIKGSLGSSVEEREAVALLASELDDDPPFDAETGEIITAGDGEQDAA